MKNKMVSIVVILLIGVGAYFIGRGYYYNNIYNYTRIINESLEKYYVSSNTADLSPIGKIMSLYKNNDEKKSSVQEKVYIKMNEWVDYLNNKYICDSNNVNSCRLYYNELINMKNTIAKAITADGEPIIDGNKYTTLSSLIDLKIEEVKEIIDDPSSVRARNYEELRLEKCNKVIECPSDCKGAMCDCTYLNSENKRESVKCKNPNPEANK